MRPVKQYMIGPLLHMEQSVMSLFMHGSDTMQLVMRSVMTRLMKHSILLIMLFQPLLISHGVLQQVNSPTHSLPQRYLVPIMVLMQMECMV